MKPSSSRMYLSIIITTRNRAEALSKTLESLEKLEVSQVLTYEILLINNGSTDKTQEILDDFIKKDPERYKCLFQPKKGKSKALNLGISRSRGNIIAFTDDDVIVDKNWIQEIWNAFKRNKEAVAVQGKILLQKEIKQLPEWVNPRDLLFCPYYYPRAESFYVNTLIGANMAIRRTAFEKYGFFDPRLGPGASGFGEETEFCERLKEAGEKIMYVPNALVLHEFDEHRFTWEYWCKRIQQQAHGNAITDIFLKQKKASHFRNRTRLLYYYIKYYLYLLQKNTQKKYKYDRRIKYMKNYINYVSQFSKRKDTISTS